jgi:hypothetical protein
LVTRKSAECVGYADGKNKKSAQPWLRSKSHSPQKNSWLALRAARKKPPQRAAISVLFPKWYNFTLSREPRFSETPSKPRRLRACNARCAPPAPPFFAFFLISPAEFLFLAEKGVGW